jgi:hypothetical protein
MVPAMLLVGLDSVQLIIIATFVEVCGGVAADALFGHKIAHELRIAPDTLKRYQYLGAFVSSIAAGIIFWLLITHFGLGTEQLFAQKAQARALLINARTFDWWVLALGGLFGLFIKQIKLNPALVLSGILMPFNLSIGLIAGGLLTLLSKDPEEWFPLWSGVFAANSVWMLVRTIL